MSKCAKCKKILANGTEAQKMVTEFIYPDKSIDFTVPSEGLKAKAGGRLHLCYHYKCFKVLAKLERRTQDEGSLIGKEGTPSAYNVSDFVMNKNEADDKGLSVEEAAAQSTEQIGAQARAALKRAVFTHGERSSAEILAKKRLDEKLEEKSNDPGEDPDREKDLKWPAGGQEDLEI